MDSTKLRQQLRSRPRPRSKPREVMEFWSIGVLEYRTPEFFPLRFGFLSQRDLRTQPGVSTPGTISRDAHPEGVADRILRDYLADKRDLGRRFFRPFRAGLDRGGFPGLKPRAESCYPFGIKPQISPEGAKIV